METGSAEVEYLVEPLEDPVPAEPDEPVTVDERDLVELPV